MKKELLLMGGSHLSYIIAHVKRGDALRLLPRDWELKIISCSDLDFCLGFKIMNDDGDLDCRSNSPLSKACAEVYGQPFVKYSPERLIGLCLGSWHHALDDPIWLTHHPADLSPGFDQHIPLSTGETLERILPEALLRVNVVKRLVESPNRFFVISVPPAPFFHEGAVKTGIPPATCQYIHWFCLILHKAALERLKVPYLDFAEYDLDPEGFLPPDLAYKFGDCHAHMEKYGALQWPRLMDFMAQRDWLPEERCPSF